MSETTPGSGVWRVPDASAALTDVQMNRFISAGFYVTVDTTANPGGEIRGQLQRVLDNFPGTDLDAAQNVISLMKREFVVVP